MYAQWGPFPPRNYLGTLLSPLILIDFLNLNRQQFIQRYIIFFSFMLMIFSQVFLNIIFAHKLLLKYYLKDILKYGTIFCSLSFLLPRLSKKDIFKTISIVLGISLIIASFQYFKFNFAFELRTFIKDDLFAKYPSRPGGLAYYTLTLSEQIFILIPMLLYHLKKKTQVNSNTIISYILLFAFSSIVILINNRNSTVALLIFYLFLIKELKFQYKKIYISIFLIFISLLTLFVGNKIRFLNFEFKNDAPRIDALFASLIIIKDNFFLGLNNNMPHLQKLMIQTKDRLPFVLNENKLGSIFPHNYFINTHIKFGLIGTFYLVFIYRKLILLTKNNIEILLFLIITTISSLAHNGGITNTSTLAIGLVIYYQWGSLED